MESSEKTGMIKKVNIKVYCNCDGENGKISRKI